MKEANVKCYAAARYPERPRAFLWHGEKLLVAEVEREWRTPAGLTFRVRTKTGSCFELAYDEGAGTWDIRQLNAPAEEG